VFPSGFKLTHITGYRPGACSCECRGRHDGKTSPTPNCL